MPQTPITVIRSPLLAYADAWALQHTLARQRSTGTIADTLLLTEHPHTYTLGRTGSYAHLLVDQATLQAQGVAVFAVDRGGDLTYHGPGQLVGYPILKLSHYTRDAHQYLRLLEQVLIDTLARFAIPATSTPGLTGVWVGSAKIAAIGIKLTAGGVSLHGFALNIDPDLLFFRQIVPCGIHGCQVTSMAAQLGQAPARALVEQELVAQFGRVFAVEMGT